MGKTPFVNQLSAITASTALACAFVGVLYTLPRSIRLLQRDNPAQIKARFAVLLVLCALTPYIVCYLLFGDFGSMGQTLLWLGIRADSIVTVSASVLLLAMLLFLGPLAEAALDLVWERNHYWSSARGAWLPRPAPLSWSAVLQSTELATLAVPSVPAQARLIAWRNFVVGPLTEEVVFRSAICALLLGAGASTGDVVLHAPLYFGVAHAHHAWEKVREGMSLKHAVMGTVLQMSYTSLFGFFVTFVFVRTAHLLPLVLVHAFCNVMGLPPLSFMHKGHPQHRHRLVLGVVYLFGIGAFVLGLYPLTDAALLGLDRGTGASLPWAAAAASIEN